MAELSMAYIVERQFSSADYYCDPNEEGITVERDIFFPPATELQIIRCEEILKCKLPKGYRNFLLTHDGAVLSTNESQLPEKFDLTGWTFTRATMVILSSEYLIEFTNQQMKDYFDIHKDNIDEYHEQWRSLVCFAHSAGQEDGSFYALYTQYANGNEW